MRTGLLGLILCLLPLGAFAEWWNPDWAYRKEILVSTDPSGANVPAEVEGVPVLVRLHSGNFGYFLDLAEDGRDLRFIAGDGKTPLKYHIEKLDPINEMALIWVGMPKLSPAAEANRIWMYYGNPQAAPAGDAPGTYDPAQVLVFHFSPDETVPVDATGYRQQVAAWEGDILPDALIGAGVRLEAGRAMRIADHPALSLDPAQGWTVSFWFRVSRLPEVPVALLERIDPASGARLSLRLSPAGLVAGIQGESGVIEVSPVPVNPGQWEHLALSLDATGMRLYLDGVEAAQAQGTVPSMAGDLRVGPGKGGPALELDEFGIAAVARPAAWVAATYKAQQPGSRLLVYGEDADQQAAGEGGESYFMITLHNVTLDGWVVIAVLAVMSAVSWVVMINKGLIVNRVRKDNRAFERQFARLAAGHLEDLDREDDEESVELEESPLLLALAGDEKRFRSSTIYRIYHAGVQELNHRMAKSVGAQAGPMTLTPQAIGAIRATLDSAMTRENQKLNAQMVLLTIAISGGPFLGLLGTVVGVMITFAVIAATGDVNVNSIAPGIAAALVATVAGLAVAIPALFGYNYLGTRIKEISADMRVFADEFIAKLAEEYS